jgi:hypothetical protein
MVTKKEPMIESDQMNEKEEKKINKSMSHFFSFKNLFEIYLDIKQSWKSTEPINDDLKKFRNYQI